MSKGLNLSILTLMAAGLVFSLLTGPGIVYVRGVSTESSTSKLGEYRGYSNPIYSEWSRESLYVTVRDGTRLAVDVFRPSIGGRAVTEPLPVIWAHDRYHRANVRSSRLATQLDDDQWLQTVLKHGYVIGVADARGSGASFGAQSHILSKKDASDAYDLTEWFAAQPWCNGKVGMFGRSYLGIIQYLCAGTAPPHLKAIFPEMAVFNLRGFLFEGGLFRHDFAVNWSRVVRDLDLDNAAAPVDGDSGQLLAKAINEHRANRYAVNAAADSSEQSNVPDASQVLALVNDPSEYLAGINKSGVAVYHLSGWQDMWPRDALLWFKNIRTPQKLVIGSWWHGGYSDLDFAAEHLRWYDYWLKDVGNGIMNEAPIHYYTIGAPKGKEWRAAWNWPLPEEVRTPFYLDGSTSGTVASRNDGTLSPTAPATTEGRDQYSIDYSATSGVASRWANGYGGQFGYFNLSPNDEKGLTYTTSALSSPMEVTGHPVVRLWAACSSGDAGLFAYLEDVNERGYSSYVTEGMLRMSHWETGRPEFNYFGLPYRKTSGGRPAPSSAKPVELMFDLQPTSYVFNSGHRIRLTITGADKDNAFMPMPASPPQVTIFRNTSYASRIDLPLIPAAAVSEQPIEAASAESAPSPSRLILIVTGILVALIVILTLAKAGKGRSGTRSKN